MSGNNNIQYGDEEEEVFHFANFLLASKDTLKIVFNK